MTPCTVTGLSTKHLFNLFWRWLSRDLLDSMHADAPVFAQKQASNHSFESQQLAMHWCILVSLSVANVCWHPEFPALDSFFFAFSSDDFVAFPLVAFSAWDQLSIVVHSCPANEVLH